MASVALLSLAGEVDDGIALAGTSLCASCGACTRHCFWHIDVSTHLAAFRTHLGSPTDTEAPPPIEAAPQAMPAFVTCWEGSSGADGQLACCGARRPFQERHPEVAEAMAREVASRMAGVPHHCGVERCANWLRSHGAPIPGVPDGDRFT
jgi:L-lactate utilization protein LutB